MARKKYSSEFKAKVTLVTSGDGDGVIEGAALRSSDLKIWPLRDKCILERVTNSVLHII